MLTFQPIAMISDGVYYPSYPVLAAKLATLKEIKGRFTPLVVTPLQKQYTLLASVITQHTIIIKNIIIVCIDRAK